MATYPNGTRSFTTKIDQVNTVWAADMNAVQDEITAIENAVGPSPSYTTTFTLDNGRRIDYGNVRNRLDAMQMNLSMPAVWMSPQWNQPFVDGAPGGFYQINNRTTTKLQWAIVDDDFGYGSANGIVLKDSGYWLISSSVTWFVINSGYMQAFLFASKDGELTRDYRLPTSTMGTTIANRCTFFGWLSGGQTISMSLYQNSGSTQSFNAGYMAGMLLRRDSSHLPSPRPFVF